jgi:Domain of unknown function (DUF4388)
MAITGNLRDFSIANLIQFNCIEKNTVQIHIGWKGYEAILFIQNGDIIHAKFRDLNGEPALYKILRFEEGDFSITKPKIYNSWKSVLLEGMRVMDESQKEKDSIVKSIALDLSRHPAIKKLLIITKSGECIQNSGFDSTERYGAFALAFLEKSKHLSMLFSIGDVTYTNYSAGENNFYFFECDNLFIIAQMSRESDIEPLFMLIKDLKGKLFTAEFEAGAINEVVSEIHI